MSVVGASQDSIWLKRYCRQIALEQVDVQGQKTLACSHVLVVGLGGLGSVASLYLAGAGVGQLTLMDPDSVELSNLHRQITQQERDVGSNKALVAEQAILARNEQTRVNAIAKAADAESLLEWVSAADVVLDCTDNFQARYCINRVCVQMQTPLVSAATIRFEGQLTVFVPKWSNSPCYACLYPESNANRETMNNSCLEQGVFAPLPGIMGTLQALEALKFLLGVGDILLGRLLLFDGLALNFRELSLPKDPGCLICMGL